MKLINKYRSPSYNLRSKNSSIKYIIIHYTAMKADIESINYLCDKKNKVSSHYIIDKLGGIYNLVNTKYRAWHAGYSFWKKDIDINSSSIGIEIVNSGHHLEFEKYTSLQLKSLKDLLFFLKKKFKINNCNILGHSDIAPYRKIDPGEKFPWKIFSNNGLTYFPKKISKKTSLNLEYCFIEKGINSLSEKTLYMLEKIGYDVSISYKNKKKFKMLIRSYQMHYLQKQVSGKLDLTTYDQIKCHYNDMLTI